MKSLENKRGCPVIPLPSQFDRWKGIRPRSPIMENFVPIVSHLLITPKNIQL